MSCAISTNQLSVTYAGQASPALHSVSVRIPEGTICAILGVTGTGKTTLLHALAGVLGAHQSGASVEGSISIGGVDYQPVPNTILFPTVAFVLDDPTLQISGMRDTAFDEVAFTLDNLGIPRERHAERIRPFLQSLGIAHLSDRNPTQLSGGEAQRVAIATMLVAEPRILLLDEPFSALDAENQHKLSLLLKDLRKTTTIVLAESRVDNVLTTADHVIVLERGRVAFEGSHHAFIHRIVEFDSLLPSQVWKETMERLATMTDQPVWKRIRKVMGWTT